MVESGGKKTGIETWFFEPPQNDIVLNCVVVHGSNETLLLSFFSRKLLTRLNRITVNDVIVFRLPLLVVRVPVRHNSVIILVKTSTFFLSD